VQLGFDLRQRALRDLEHAAGKIGSVAQPLRIAVSGSTVSPPIWDTLVLVGRDATLARLDRCVAWAMTLG